MNLQIHAQDFPLTDRLRQHVVTRFNYALNHGRDVVRCIVVRLSDVNNPCSGVDKCCGIEIRLKGTSALTVEDTQADLYIAIDRATERIGRTLGRKLVRQREFFVMPSARRQAFAEKTPCSR